MCGICGTSNLTDTTRRMMPYLLWSIEDRGRDSWGATDGTDCVKVLGPVTSSFERHADHVLGWDRAIFHTRAASTGEVTVENQHPFRFVRGGTIDPEGNIIDTPEDPWLKTVVGIHNGIVSNHLELKNKYSRHNFDVDSMHIFRHIVDGRPMSEIYGWGNLAWYDYTPEDRGG